MQAVKWAALSAPIILNLGMFSLFLDLEFKVHVWRFYTAFVPTSPMSWGSWMLIIFMPFSVLQAMILWKEQLMDIPVVNTIIELTEKHLQKFALINVQIGAGVGVYTGILLSTFYARPLWSSSILGFLFLLSGLSAAAAAMVLIASPEEKHTYSRIDIYLISLEIFAVALFIIGGITSSENVREAMIFLISGSYAPWFWLITISAGLVVPLILEIMEMMGKVRYSVLVPFLVLIGSLSLRFIIVYAGQAIATFS